jgi:hypothetical protein
MVPLRSFDTNPVRFPSLRLYVLVHGSVRVVRVCCCALRRSEEPLGGTRTVRRAAVCVRLTSLLAGCPCVGAEWTPAFGAFDVQRQGVGTCAGHQVLPF